MNTAHAVPVSRPVIEDARSCDQWLARAALADSRQACATFVGLLDELEDRPPAPGAFVEILDRLRRPMRAALDDQMRRLSSRPLPLSPTEENTFVHARDLWLSLVRAWQKLRDTAAARDSEIAQARALTSLRVIESAAGLISVHFAARRDIPSGLWHWLHEGYQHAERHHLAETEVASGSETRTGADVYAELLLVALAHPYGLGARELGWTRSWARRWAHKVKLWRSAENGGGPAIDLEADAAPRWTPAGVPGAGIRFIDCTEIGRSIRRRQKKLEQGAQPAELGLGNDCARPAVDHLLAALARGWSDSQQLRRFPRRAASSRAELAFGVEAIYEFIAGKMFSESEDPWKLNRRAADQMHIFQRAIEHEQRRQSQFQGEGWETVDESAEGFQLARTGPGARIALRQLVALRGEGAPNFLLCEVRWARQAVNGAVYMGVKALPGLPQACSLRLSAAGARAPGWAPAFLLPLAANVEPTLAVPAGVYQNGREAELKTGERSVHIRMNGLLRHGHDFDWVNFVEE